MSSSFTVAVVVRPAGSVCVYRVLLVALMFHEDTSGVQSLPYVGVYDVFFNPSRHVLEEHMIRNGLADVNAVGPQEPESLPAEKPLPSEENVEKACPPILTVMDMTPMFVVVLFFITNL